MKLRDIARRGWRKYERFAYSLDYALDHSQHSEVGLRVRELEHEVHSQGARLTTLSEQLRVLTAEVRQSAGTRG